jgi:hypothetical protein
MARGEAAISPDALAAFADDPDIQDTLKALILETLKYQVHVMKFGNAAAKANVAKVYGPVAARIAGTNSGKEMDQLRAEMLALMAEMRDAPFTNAPHVSDLPPRQDSPTH